MRHTKLNVSNQGGFSAIGLIVGTVLLSGVLLSVGVLMVQSKEVETKATNRGDMDRVHLLAVQTLRSSKNIRRALNLNAIAEENESKEINTNLLNCLTGKGYRCDKNPEQVPKEWRDLPAVGQSYGQTYKCAGANCNIASKVSYRITCSSATSCEGVEIQLKTTQESGEQGGGGGGHGGHGGANSKERINTIKIPVALLTNKTEISYGCAANANIQSLDYKRSRANCFSSRPVNCGVGIVRPLQKAGYADDPTSENCPQPVNDSCGANKGLKTAGLYGAACAN